MMSPYGGSVNQIVPSDFTTTSLGALKRLPCQRSTTVRCPEPSGAVRKTARRPCEQCSSEPSRSRVWPLVNSTRSRQTVMPSRADQRSIRSLGMSLHSTLSSSAIHTGPSLQRAPVQSRSRQGACATTGRRRSSNTSIVVDSASGIAPF